VAYNFNDRWALAAEEYDSIGPPHGLLPLSKQFHEVWATTDYSGTKFLGLSVETGVGYGLTAASDKWTLKLMCHATSISTHRVPEWGKARKNTPFFILSLSNGRNAINS
jgi:hypothetical protein